MFAAVLAGRRTPVAQLVALAPFEVPVGLTGETPTGEQKPPLLVAPGAAAGAQRTELKPSSSESRSL